MHHPNDYLLSLLLGIVEGLTEYLPVSSTAHLRIAEALLGVDLSDGFWKLFSIFIQIGAILCLPIYFAQRLLKFLKTFPRGERGDRNVLTHPLSLTIVAFVCTAIPAFLLTKLIGKNLENLHIIGVSLVVGGIVMWIIDVLYTRGVIRHTTDHLEDMSLGQAIWVGCCQILSAVFPGTSRSMSTIAGGQVARMSRAAALEFSFFLSIPTMFVAVAYDLLKSLRPSAAQANPVGVTHLDPHAWVLLLIGTVVSFIVAYLSVAWFMQWVRTRGFVPFAIYRIVIGVAVLIWLA